MQILASIGQMEFFYDQSPDVMRSCCMALQLLSVAIGSYLSGALVSSTQCLSRQCLQQCALQQAQRLCLSSFLDFMMMSWQ